MNRRRFLACAATVAVAGCPSGSDDATPADTPTETPAETPTPTPDEPGTVEPGEYANTPTDTPPPPDPDVDETDPAVQPDEDTPTETPADTPEPTPTPIDDPEMELEDDAWVEDVPASEDGRDIYHIRATATNPYDRDFRVTLVAGVYTPDSRNLGVGNSGTLRPGESLTATWEYEPADDVQRHEVGASVDPA